MLHSYIKQSLYLQCKSIDWFLYENNTILNGFKKEITVILASVLLSTADITHCNIFVLHFEHISFSREVHLVTFDTGSDNSLN